jgi:hypothetical protein
MRGAADTAEYRGWPESVIRRGEDYLAARLPPSRIWVDGYEALRQ